MMRSAGGWRYEQLSYLASSRPDCASTQALRRDRRDQCCADRWPDRLRGHRRIGRAVHHARRNELPRLDLDVLILDVIFVGLDVEGLVVRIGSHLRVEQVVVRWFEQRIMTATVRWRDWSCQVRLTVTDSSTLEPARHHVVDLMREVERSASRFVPTSDICRINEGAGHLVPVSRRTVALVDVALDAAADTEGLVDPTVGAHVVQVGYAGDIATVRDQLIVPERDYTLRQADWTGVRVDHELSRVGVPSGLALDLGATAKPWTADVAAHGIAASFGTGVLVEIGGDVAVAGNKPTPWQIHVSEKAGQAGERVGLTSGGIATSSSAGRRWRTPAGDAHHIIDPRTGVSADGPWRTATVWARSAVDANTASTAAIVLGEDAVAFLAELDHPARLVGHDGHVETVGAWPSEKQVA